MTWEKYGSSVEEYLQLDNRYDFRLEYIDEVISSRDGTPVILLGGLTANKTALEKAIVMVCDMTEEEVKQLATFVVSLRSKQDEES